MMSLNTKDFMECRARLNTICEQLLQVKGSEYARGDVVDNRLDNFERIAARVGVTPLQTLVTYLLKHVDSLEKYARTGEEGSESIEYRIADARNYIDLMYGMVMHDRIAPNYTADSVVDNSFNVGEAVPLAPKAKDPISVRRVVCTCPNLTLNSKGKLGSHHDDSCPNFRDNDAT